MSNVYEILDICLQEIDNGADVDTVLFRYPDHADELRPILEASVQAKEIAVPAPSTDVVRRNRAKVLQQAAQMREAKATASRRLWSVPLRRMLVSLAMVAALFVGSTQLVGAASTTLPGDQLYPVKRTWEDVLVMFTFNVQARETLEREHENERLHELQELFTEGRSVQVDFSGLVSRQNGDLWLVAGIPVAVSAQTDLPAQPIAVGSAIHVVGVTQNDGAVLAQRIELLPAGVPFPEVNDDSFEVEQEHSGDSAHVDENASEDNSGKGSGDDTPKVEETQTSDDSGSDSGSSESEHQSVEGKVESINGNIIVVNGQILNVSSAEIKGTPTVGANVKVEGYYDENGVFIVTKIEYESIVSDDGNGPGSDGSSNQDSNKDSGSDDKGSKDSGGDHSGGSDDSGGGDSGGSGGGGDD